MRIGILTFHAAHNYGAVLQCYALQTYLEECGHEVSVIDYRLPVMLAGYNVFFWRRWVSYNPIVMMKRIYQELRLLPQRKKRFLHFNDFISRRLHLQPACTITERPYDVVIIGSDQVWNTNITYGFNDYYWGLFPHPDTTKIISYAASMQDCWTPADEERIIQYISKFHAVSVRESSLAEKLRTLIPRKEIYHVADPTMLLTQEQWNRIAISSDVPDKYLLLYQVESEERTLQIAKAVSQDLGLPLIMLSSTLEVENTPAVAPSSPEQFLGLFRDASFVVCSSFHGTVFSLMYHVPFYSVQLDNGKDNRVFSLLRELGLEKRFIRSYAHSNVTEIMTCNCPALNDTQIVRLSYQFLNNI